eukprot:TRINITY_DN1570_c0_g1_i4.p1 TRINITY_DN1570_c0_g1~~TRINITY_DN1570_c0_g1_i4.p1  ORF type:complete len:116 (+),score=10.11 TRINITY_DN1570_c0_g1_i4:107-454(+)
MEPISKEDRVRGAFLGLAAGVRNGGPMRMAMRLAESLLDKRQLDMNDVVKRYHDWFRGPPFDSEKAFDTGPTFVTTFRTFKEGDSNYMIRPKQRILGESTVLTGVCIESFHFQQT